MGGKRKQRPKKIPPSARAHGRNNGNLIALLDDGAFLALARHVYIVQVDRHQRRIQNLGLEAGMPRLQLGEELRKGQWRGQTLGVSSGEGAGAGEVEDAEVAARGFGCG